MIKCSATLAIYLFFWTCLINSIIQGHSYKILCVIIPGESGLQNENRHTFEKLGRNIGWCKFGIINRRSPIFSFIVFFVKSCFRQNLLVSREEEKTSIHGGIVGC